MKARFIAFALASLVLLAGCNDGGGSDDGSDIPVFDVELTWDFLGEKISFNNCCAFPFNEVEGGQQDWTGGSDNRYVRALLKVKRWNVDPTNNIFIPVKINGVPLVDEALNRIEAKLGMTLFDRDSIAFTSDDQITHGIIFRSGTAKGPDGASCGHVGDKDSTINFPYNWYQDDGEFQTVLTVNLGKGTGECSIDVGLVIHEVMHALGMHRHYDGFGQSPPGVRLNHEGNLPYSVLYNIYFTEIGTHYDDFIVQFPFTEDPDAEANQGRRGISY